jgi:hypothetical protein
MRTCTNCGTTITCGCQDRIASNGIRVCGNCITSYEAKIKLEALLAQTTTTENENPPS